jgi:UDP-N-acetylmuramoylalanine--D-glutamate ligase
MKIGELKKYNKILIAGFGKEGHSTLALLKHVHPTAQVDMTDITNGSNYLENQNNYDLVIKSPGIHKSQITNKYTTATNIFFANVHNKIIGVTGTKGKSTTSSLIYEMLKAAGKKVTLLGNIGNPMVDVLLRPIDTAEIFVVELSSYQLDDIKYSPHISVVVNLFPEHMNYHGTVENYYNAKKNIIAHVNIEDYFVYNPAYPEFLTWAKNTYCKAIPYVNEIPFDLTGMKLVGEHNKDNIRAAITVGQILEVPVESMKKAVVNFQPLRHRLQLVGTFKEIQFYDDAISTTPESTIAAIKALKTVGTIFLGGQNRGYDFSSLISSLKEYNIPNIVLFPDSGEDIKKLLEKEQDYKPNIFETRDMKQAVAFGFEHTAKSSVCLLSTASPSYSIWKNFEEKGDFFQAYVNELGK